MSVLFTVVLFTVVLFTGTIHENYFWIFGFVARVRARADNVFKGNVNNKRNSREYDHLY